ncbi:phospholipase [Enterococcus sp. JM4C]|uniref:alpha/beta hydrolase n=1 Tax=Candidatus Enterococcus huntleyi TaxID=1857217 RepID=UPI00137B5C7A|nr:alpha/beta hydrolase [Enterococcus sp. JM4C]KAF1298337.1 phospholipase [Enterococcus sp. JM4C]
MDYLFEEGTGRHLLLLHGTGGDETSLVSVARLLDKEATILSFRGAVQEQGMNRFFKRNGLNQFDYQSLDEESDRLLAEIYRLSEEKGIDIADWVIVGYSNGANIAAYFMMERETRLDKAILLHPMSLGHKKSARVLADKNIWLSFGEGDPIVEKAVFEELVTNFREQGANVAVEVTETGHQVAMPELNSAKKWLEEQAWNL